MILLSLAVLTTSMKFYVDPINGSDAFAGTSPSKAWRSFAPSMTHRFGPGDQLLIAGGSHIEGPLTFKGVMGLTVSSYGKGTATIEGKGGSGIVVQDATNLKIENLSIRGAGRKANDASGVSLEKVGNSTLSNLDVEGFRLSGVALLGCEKVTVQRVFAHNNGSDGISVNGGYDKIPQSKEITIRDCRAIGNLGDPKNLDNHSGSGIVVGGVDGCLIEYCEAAENGADMPRTGNGPVGIWAWNANRVTIQHCISHDNKSPGGDGGGFDLDGGVTNSIIQHNLSYYNFGTGYLLCQYDGGGPWKNNSFINNISLEDGTKNGNCGFAIYLPPDMKNMSDSVVEGNTIINSGYGVTTINDVPGVIYRRNVFLCGKEAFKVWGEGGFKNSKLDTNLFWGVDGKAIGAGNPENFASLTTWKDSGGVTADPQLRLPIERASLPTDPRKLSKATQFDVGPKSPCRIDGKVRIGANLRQAY